MPTELLTTRFPATTKRLWALELDAEVAPAGRTVTDREARVLAGLLARISGVEQVSAEPHCDGRFVLVGLALEALDLSDAVDRACAFLHSCAADAGLGPLVLVAARSPR